MDGPVHAVVNAVLPEEARLGMPFLDSIELVDAFKDVTDASVAGATSEALLPRERHTVAHQNGMYQYRTATGTCRKKHFCVDFRGPVKDSGMREACDAVYGDKHVLFAAGHLHLGAVAVHEAQRRFFKLLVLS